MGLLGSTLFHLVVLLPLIFVMFTSADGMKRMPARFDPDDFDRLEEEPPPEEPEITPGIDAKNPSTLTWIGYEEYQKHMAELAQVDQAAFDELAAGTGPQPNPLQAQTEGQGKPSEAEVNEAPGPSPADPKDENPSDPEGLKTPFNETDLPILQPKSEGPRSGGAPEVASGEAKPEPKPPKPEAEPKSEGKNPDQSPSKPSTSGPGGPATGVKPSETEPKPADPSDKQSDATSTIDVPLREMGKPIAREGLELKPQRPQFTTLTMVTAAPRNPLVLIKFGPDGRPKKGTAVIESSGDSRVDIAIENSLFRWRARGEKLKDLKADETADIRIRIMLGRK